MRGWPFAFWRTYYGILDELPPTVTPVIHIHGAIMVLWLFILAV